MAKKPARWERIATELTDAFEAFKTYLYQIAPRSVNRVHDGEGRSVRPLVVAMWAKEYDWVQRAIAYDEHLSGVIEEERAACLTEGGAALGQRQLRILNTALDIVEKEFLKLYRQVDSSEESTVKPGVLIRLADRVIALQRLINGQTTESVEVKGEFDFSETPVEKVRELVGKPS